MKYDAITHMVQHRFSLWAQRKRTDLEESMPKQIPCHVTEVNKDFLKIQFEPTNNIFTLPTVQMTQNFSRFGREPTQKGDKGFASAGGYYMGGNTGYSGGSTNYYPRANLSTLSFQPLANLNAPQRDYDQHHETGGPNGWMVRTMEPQQEQAGPGQPSGGQGGQSVISTSTMRAHQRVMQQRNFVQFSKPIVAPRNGTTGSNGSSSTSGTSGQSGQTSQSATQYGFDKNDVCTVQSYDTNHQVVADKNNKKIYLKVPTNENVYVGGDGKEGSYAQLVTTKGPVINAQGRYA